MFKLALAFSLLYAVVYCNVGYDVVSVVWQPGPLQGRGLYYLTEQHFDRALRNYRYVLVLFYSPHSHSSRAVEDALEEVERRTTPFHPNLKVAKVDGEHNPGLVARYHISSYPTVYLFVHGQPRAYTGYANAHDIIQWLKEQMHTYKP